MPRWSMRVPVPGGVAIVCGSSPRRRCSTPGCRGDATLECDYPVQRKGKAGTCDRRCCAACAKSVGDDLDYCAAHARAEAKP